MQKREEIEYKLADRLNLFRENKLVNQLPSWSLTENMAEAWTPAGWARLYLRWAGVGVEGAVGRDELLHTGSTGLAYWLPNMGRMQGVGWETIQGVRWN